MNRRFGKVANERNFNTNEKDARNDKFQRISLLIQAVVALSTLLLFWQALRQNRGTEKSINMLIDQFKVSNEPFLQAKDFVIKKGKSMDTITYTLFNLGQYPAKILAGKFGYLQCLSKLDNPAENGMLKRRNDGKIVSAFDDTIINTYVIKETPIFKTFISPQLPLPDYFGSSCKDSAYNFFGEIFYINEIDSTKRVYYFNTRIIFSNSKPIFAMISSENKNILGVNFSSIYSEIKGKEYNLLIEDK